jgi:signal transduction histidine kinase
MQQSLRTRLFFNGLIIILLGMVLAGVLFWHAAERLYIETQTENLLAQARLTAAALQDHSLPVTPIEPYLQTTNALPGLHTRLLGTEGAVLIEFPMVLSDAMVQVPPVENSTPVTPGELLQRPEIIAAREGQASSAIREVAPDNRRVLYAAAPVYDDQGNINGLVYLAMPLPRGGLPAGFIYQLVGAGLVAVLLALLAGSLLARRITAPVSAITRGATAVSGGDLNQRVPVHSGISELDDLGKSFNRMVDSLKQSDRAQNAFVADVAHELRTPLTVIKGTIETLEDGAMDDIKGRGPLLTSMQRETDRLIRLVNDLLVLTRADAGMLKLVLKPLDLGDLAKQRCEHLTPLAGRRGVTFEIQVKKTACVVGDEDRVAQVLDNLLDNATRFSPDGAMVIVEVAQQGKETWCSIHDDGPGIPKKHLPFIFERFYRAESSRNRQSGGAGLGLAIVHALIQLQGGELFVESQPSRGTTFRFSLPTKTDCHETD